MKFKLSTILITTGIVIWLSAAFFIYSSRYTSAAEGFSYSRSAKENEDYINVYYSKLKFKLTLILLKNDMVFGYYENSIKEGKIVSIDETTNLIEAGWKMFSKDSLVIVIKRTKDASYGATRDILDKMSPNQIKKYSMIYLNKEEKEFLKLAK